MNARNLYRAPDCIEGRRDMGADSRLPQTSRLRHRKVRERRPTVPRAASPCYLTHMRLRCCLCKGIVECLLHVFNVCSTLPARNTPMERWRCCCLPRHAL